MAPNVKLAREKSLVTREWIANGAHRVAQIIECLVEGPLTGTENACEPFWVRKRLVFRGLDVMSGAFYAHLTD
jgi:hypothetical protein